MGLNNLFSDVGDPLGSYDSLPLPDTRRRLFPCWASSPSRLELLIGSAPRHWRVAGSSNGETIQNQKREILPVRYAHDRQRSHVDPESMEQKALRYEPFQIEMCASKIDWAPFRALLIDIRGPARLKER